MASQTLKSWVGLKFKRLRTMLNGINKEKLSSRCTKTFDGHFLQSEVKSLSTIKAELLSHCSLIVVYDNRIKVDSELENSM